MASDRIGVWQRPGPQKQRPSKFDRTAGPTPMPAAQTAPPAIRSLEQLDDDQKRVSAAWGVPGIKAAARTKKEILLHTCFFQDDQDKPRYCNCDVHVTFAEARNMINRGWAEFLTYKRSGRVLENRKVIVATRAFMEAKAKSHDASEHKRPLSIEGFLEYHMAPISAEVTSGLDKEIQNVRLGEIAERKKEVSSARRRVSPKGNSIDSDSSQEEMANAGEALAISRPDRGEVGGVAQNLNAPLDQRSLPSAEEAGQKEAREFTETDSDD
jgi:hypothetical protein